MKAETIEHLVSHAPAESQPGPTLTKFFLGVLASLLTAAIVANTAMLFQFGERLARLETKLELLAEKTHNTNRP